MQTELFDNRDRDELLEKRKNLLGESWFNRLGKQFDEPYMKRISMILAQRRQVTVVYPSPENVFRAYQLTPYETVKVVILAQD